VIRQAISCDICGTEMLSANHWFIARVHGSELRISLWSGQARLGPSVRHLCGHKCLHKLLDDFLTSRTQTSPPVIRPDATQQAPSKTADSSLTSAAAFPAPRFPVIGSCAMDPESSARLLPPAQPFAERTPPLRLRAEAWKREMERERQEQVAGRRTAARGPFSVIEALVKSTRQGD
jgi:hypothetical protein